MPEMSVFPGVTRRDFLKICGGLAALIGLGQAGAADVAQALEQIAKRPNVVWSDFQECLGCSVNLLQSRTPEVATLILQQISLNYHEAVMAAAGDEGAGASGRRRRLNCSRQNVAERMRAAAGLGPAAASPLSA